MIDTTHRGRGVMLPEERKLLLSHPFRVLPLGEVRLRLILRITRRSADSTMTTEPYSIFLSSVRVTVSFFAVSFFLEKLLQEYGTGRNTCSR